MIKISEREEVKKHGRKDREVRDQKGERLPLLY